MDTENAEGVKRILSLGAGVQSSTVLLMSCVGELPKLVGTPYVHRDCVPLDQADIDKETKQLNLWQEECTGMCGV